MPISSRRKAKQGKKNRTLIQPNQHSSAAVQLQPQGPSLFENHTKKMEETFNGTLHEDTHKVQDSLSEDKKVVLQVASDGDDGKSMSLTQTTDVDIAITDEQIETQDVSESVADSLDPSLNGDAEVEVKETHLSPLEDINELSLTSGNEGLRETEVVETTEDMTVAEEKVETDKLHGEGEEVNSNEIITNTDDVVSREVFETSDAKYDESDKVSVSPTAVEKSLVISTDEKVGEQSDVQESSSYESAKDSFQTSTYVPDAESNGTIQQGKTEEPGSFENPTIIPVTRRQHTSWKSCCGLLEILRHGDR